MELMADAIYDVIKKEGVHKFVAVGFSWGPVVLGQFELKYPGRITQLIILDHSGQTQWPPVGDPTREQFILKRENTYAKYLALTRDGKIALAATLVPSTSPEDLKEWVKYFWDYSSYLLSNMNYNAGSEDVCNPVPWTIPIMGIYRKTPNLDKLYLYYPGIVFQVIGGNAHLIQWEQAELVNGLIDDFLPDRPSNKY